MLLGKKVLSMLEKLFNFFSTIDFTMGGYQFYVWASYILALLLILILSINSFVLNAKVISKLKLYFDKFEKMECCEKE